MPFDTRVVDEPESLGLDSARLEELVERARQELDSGPLPSCQLAIARHGQLALYQTLGDAPTDSRYVIYSCVKPLVASAIWMLLGDGLLRLDQAVSSIIPAFDREDMDTITVEQVLLHTAGFPHAPMGPPDWWTRSGRLSKMQGWRLNWEPGSRIEYHATSAHWVLAELIDSVTQTDYRDFINRRILQPLGLNHLRLGVSPNQQSDINKVINVGRAPTAEEMEQLVGVAIELPEIMDTTLLRYNEAETLELGVPGAGGVSTAADMALFYQALLHNPDQLWNQQVLDDATGNIRAKFKDPTTNTPANRSIGLVIKGDDKHANRRGMGKTTSWQAFGHQGVGGQIAWADPQSGISFCLLTNGLDANPIRQARFGVAMSNRAGACFQQPA